MGQGRGGNDVADGVDVRLGSAHVRIDLHETAIHFDLRLLQSAVFCYGAAAGGGEHDIDVEGLLLSFRRDDDLHSGVAHLRRFDFRIGKDFDPLLLEEAGELFGDLLILDRQQLRQHFDDGGLGAETREDRSELASHRAGADDEHRLRHFLQQKNVIGVDDALAVGLDVRQVARHRAHGQNDVLRRQAPGLLSFGDDFDDAAIGDASEAGEAFDLVLLEQELDALGILVDDRLLAILSGFEVETDIPDSDPEFFRPVDLLVDFGVLQQGLGGDAASMRAGATDERILLDDRHLHAELTGANSGDVSARAAADDHDVVLWICQARGIIRAPHPCPSPRKRGEGAATAAGEGSYCAGT